MILEEWQGYLLTIIDNKIYLADSRQDSQINDRLEYEWYYFELPQNILRTTVKDDVLYLGCGDNKIYTLSNNEDTRLVDSYWTT